MNGLELWRVLWRDNEGGALQVEVADLGALHTFPACPSEVDLPIYLGEWLSLAQEQGGDLPERHLTTLLTKMLPSEVRSDVKKMGLLNAPHMQIVNYLKLEQHRWNDSKVAQAHVQRRFASLPGGRKQSVHALQANSPEVEAEGASSKPSGTTSPSENMIDKLTMVCAAREPHISDKPRGRDERRGKQPGRSPSRSPSRSRPDAAFTGCCHCGRRAGAPRF